MTHNSEFCLSPTEGYVTAVYGTLYVTDENDEQQKVGTLEAWIIRLGEMVNKGVRLSSRESPIAWVPFAQSVATEEIMYFVAGNDIELKDEIVDQIGEESSYTSAVHFLESVIIEPKSRGQGLGLAFLHDYIRFVAGIAYDAVIVCHPAPLESKSEKERLRGAKKLRNYWGKLGFVHLKHSEYMAMMAYRLNSAESVGFENMLA